jgi:gas vesicle protein
MNGRHQYGNFFGGAAFLGAVTMVLCSWLSWGLGVATFLVVLVMVGYFLLLTTSGDRVSAEAADSIYYLGFSFTLFALMVAVRDVAFEDAVRIDVILVVKAFGLALCTTAFGLIGRVYLVSNIDEQMQDGPEQAAIDQSASALRRLEHEVGATIQTLKDSRENISGRLEELRAAELSAAQRAFADHEAALAEQSASFNRKVLESSSGLDEHAQEAINKVMEVGVAAISEVGATAKSARDAINNSFSGIASRLDEEAREAQNHAQEAASRLQSATSGFRTASQDIQNALSEALRNWKSQIEDAGTGLTDGVSANLKASSKKLEASSKGLTDGLDAVASRLAGVKFDTVDTAFELAGQSINEACQKLSTELNSVGEKLSTSFPAEEEYSKIFDPLTKPLNNAATECLKAMDKMKEAAATTGVAFAKVTKELAAVNDDLGFTRVKTSVTEFASMMQTQKDSLERSAEELDGVAQSIAAFNTTVGDNYKGADEHLKQIDRIRLELFKATTAMAKDVSISERALGEFMQALVAHVNDLRNEFAGGDGRARAAASNSR